MCRSYASALFDRTPEEIRLALDVYQQELNRLMQPPNAATSSSSQQQPSSTSAVGSGQSLNPPPTTTTAPVSNNSTLSSTSAPSHHINNNSSHSNNNQPANGLPQDLSLPKSGGRGGSESSEEGSDRDREKDRSTSKGQATLKCENGSAKHPASGAGDTAHPLIKTERDLSSSVYMPHSLHNILRPSSSPSPDESPAPTGPVSGGGNSGNGNGSGSGNSSTGGGSSGGVASPLQRIASITNSLMSQPSNPTLPQVTQRPMKAILPPITQQQFDTYQNLNTEDIVKKVSQSPLTCLPPGPPKPYILVNPSCFID